MRLFAFPPPRCQLRSSRIQLLLEQNKNKRGGGEVEKGKKGEKNKGKIKKKSSLGALFFYYCNSPGMIPTRVGNIDGGGGGWMNN